MPKISVLAVDDSVGIRRTASDERAAHPFLNPAFRPFPSGVDVVAIGVSTDGPNALAELISQFPADFPAPIALGRHLPPILTKSPADRFASKARIPVYEAQSARELLPGQAYVASGDFSVVAETAISVVRIQTRQEPPQNFCRPAVDLLLRAVTRVYAGRSPAAIMTRMEQGGPCGCQRIRKAGGQRLAKDAATSGVWGMPGLLAHPGQAEKALPLGGFAGQLVRRVHPDGISDSAAASRPFLKDRQRAQ